jgi:hypothetical protein
MTRRDLFATLASIVAMSPSLPARVEPENNLHAAIPAKLLARLQALAAKEHIPFDEIVTDAVWHWLAFNAYLRRNDISS